MLGWLAPGCNHKQGHSHESFRTTRRPLEWTFPCFRLYPTIPLRERVNCLVFNRNKPTVLKLFLHGARCFPGPGPTRVPHETRAISILLKLRCIPNKGGSSYMPRASRRAGQEGYEHRHHRLPPCLALSPPTLPLQSEI